MFNFCFLFCVSNSVLIKILIQANHRISNMPLTSIQSKLLTTNFYTEFLPPSFKLGNIRKLKQKRNLTFLNLPYNMTLLK